MKEFYILVEKAFALQMKGKESTVNPGSIFGYAVTKDGKYVVSSASTNNFPNEFAGMSPFVVLALGVEDFPVINFIK